MVVESIQNTLPEIGKQLDNGICKDERYYYFRATNEQLDGMVKDCYEAMDLVEEKIKDVTFTYEALFGDLPKSLSTIFTKPVKYSIM